jgi:hypothetical protein
MGILASRAGTVAGLSKMIMRPVSFGMGRMLASGHDLSRSIAETLGCNRARRIRAFTVTIVVSRLVFAGDSSPLWTKPGCPGIRRMTAFHCAVTEAVARDPSTPATSQNAAARGSTTRRALPVAAGVASR